MVTLLSSYFIFYVDDMLIVSCDSMKIYKLKKVLNESFVIKELRYVKQIPIKIARDLQNEKFWPFQDKYIENVFDRFNVSKIKKVLTPFADYFKLNIS